MELKNKIVKVDFSDMRRRTGDKERVELGKMEGHKNKKRQTWTNSPG